MVPEPRDVDQLPKGYTDNGDKLVVLVDPTSDSYVETIEFTYKPGSTPVDRNPQVLVREEKPVSYRYGYYF